MSDKLISADDLLKYTVLAGEIKNPYMEVVPAYFLREAPAVDAVAVVRCSQCLHWKKDFAGCTDFVGRCEYANYMVGTAGYCVYGERRKENAPTVEAEPVRDGCEHCKDGTYHGQVLILCNDNVTRKIEYCPSCGAKMDGGSGS